MPKIIHEGSGIYRTTLLLRRKKNNSWIWTGKNQIQTNTNEDPLIIKCKGKEFYFYSTGLEKSNDDKTWHSWWKGNKSNLSYSTRAKMIKKLHKFIDHTDWNWEYILLKYKVNFLNDISKNCIEESAIINQWVNNIKYKELPILERRVDRYENTINKHIIAPEINKKIIEINASIHDLFKNSPNLTKIIDSLEEDLTNNLQNSIKKSNTSEQKRTLEFQDEPLDLSKKINSLEEGLMKQPLNLKKRLKSNEEKIARNFEQEEPLDLSKKPRTSHEEEFDLDHDI